MKEVIVQLIQTALKTLQNREELVDVNIEPQLTHTKSPEHGDFSSNIAMILAKSNQKNPRELAQKIVEVMPAHESIKKIEIAGPGFINFFVNAATIIDVVTEILREQERYGFDPKRESYKINIEFVSCNPTGPLHVGHGRNAATGASIANLLSTIGYKVHREYYVNDAGRQMAILATSVWLRYLQSFGAKFTFPSNGYKGEYILEIVEVLKQQVADSLIKPIDQVFLNVPPDFDEEKNTGDKEAHIDAIVTNAQKLLGSTNYDLVFELTLDAILTDIREDLGEFGVMFDEWFSERELLSSGTQQRVLSKLEQLGHVYEEDGAKWFRATDFGDEKDRVLQRKNGQFTYFANDVSYHVFKYERGIDKMIDVFGADHHGYVPRMQAALKALGYSSELGDILDVVLVQFAILYRGDKRVQMSTRSGSFVTLRELRQEVGNDAARFFYVMRKADQHLDFDLDLAKSQSADNPVYYIQYAHARICSVFRQLQEQNIAYDEIQGLAALTELNSSYEQALLRSLASYKDLLERAALAYEPHRLAQYLRDLAHQFHSYYNAQRFIVENGGEMMQARLVLLLAVKQIMVNCLHILGVSAPERM
ncbi:MAG: arginine--tRNA ligase [Gammaproteobacteria bacterium]|jgi:arginyl-tRNA synthetase